ncbi:HD domain-containing protein [Variovorax sp. PAMC 28711]|uniref:HD domain-containing protein n=1 Tax=Variovorax sp. PAMC 28711 TaxID=1795631 RepID=UPI00078C9C08|nr:HD domain-containing protein [Variovorax sp. PAMC 28711]AMM26005.1 phosphohydrolase [Variovorax sp. PAMC 28711]
MSARANFVRMQDSTREDWQVIGGEFMQFAGGLPERVVKHLQILQGDYGGFPVDRYTHSLQTATRALRAGRDEEYVVCALLHDIGDTLGSFNHPDIAAAILKPFVGEQNHWMVQNHGIFQGHYFFHHIGLDRDMRENFRSHPNFDHTAEFCELYDNPAFDPKAETLPIEEFMPMLKRVMGQPKQSIYKAALQPASAAIPETV